MILNRRQFLISSAATLMATTMLGSCAKSQRESWLVSCCKNKDGKHHVGAFTPSGQLINAVPLPLRGHASLALLNQPGHALVFARRPDTFAMLVDFTSGEIVKQFNSQSDTHFYGHGTLSSDGSYLFTSENHFDTGDGLIIVRDTQNYQVVDRITSGGIGPHDIELMPDGKSLVVANGGIKTHPDWPRMKLNLDSMEPNLAYLDIASGKVLDTFSPPDPQLSLRHLSVRDDGSVFVGAQYQYSKQHVVPLVFSHKGESEFQAFSATDEQWLGMRQYTASLSVKDDILAVSCPRGNVLTLWDTVQRKYMYGTEMGDVAGLARLSGQLVASSGHGSLRHFDRLERDLDSQVQDWYFDNHMTVIEGA